MRWFNEVRGDGLIESDDGEPYTVRAADFVGAPPVGRCAGLEVVFEAAEPSQATEVMLLEQADPRRARLRSHRAGRSSH
jgi:hypothetical protein